MNQLSLQLATEADIPLIMEFIAQAKQHLKDQGIDQWQDGYPNQDSIVADINAHKGFLAISEQPTGNTAIGYLCIDFDGEPAYDTLHDGNWHTNAPYAVVHRFTIGDSYKGKGLACAVFALVDDYCKAHGIAAFRIDTALENFKMQHLILKSSFALCGTVRYGESPRLAYDKIIL